MSVSHCMWSVLGISFNLSFVGERVMSISRRVLILCGIAVVVLGLAQGRTFASVIALWDFGEKAVGQTAAIGDTLVDSVGGHNATVTRAGLTYVAGDPAGVGFNHEALSFSGTTGYGLIPATTDLAFDGSFTIEAMVKTSTAIDGAGIAGSGNGVLSSWYLRQRAAGTVQGFARGTSQPPSASVTSVTTISDGAWHDVAFVYDRTGQTATLYVDGTVSAQVSDVAIPGTIGDPSQDFFLGTMNPTSEASFTGAIDFIRISNTALTPSQFLGVPEPGALTLLGCGLIALVAYAWRRRR